MRAFIIGIIVGSLISTSLGLAGNGKDKDTLGIGRGEEQRKYDYYRERGQQLDIEHMRKQLDREASEKKYGRRPC